jgi:hypothetical protein
MPVIEGTQRLKGAVGEYDFAVDGGGTGTITLRSGDSRGNYIPNGAVVLGGYVEVDTAVASATGTVAVNLEGTGDLLPATGQAGLTLGRKSITPAFTGAASLKTTTQRSLNITIATAALTAGKFRVVVFYR